MIIAAARAGCWVDFEESLKLVRVLDARRDSDADSQYAYASCQSASGENWVRFNPHRRLLLDGRCFDPSPSDLSHRYEKSSSPDSSKLAASWSLSQRLGSLTGEIRNHQDDDTYCGRSS